MKDKTMDSDVHALTMGCPDGIRTTRRRFQP
jgi:hypothetical protein